MVYLALLHCYSPVESLGDTSMRNLLYAFGAGFLAFAILYFPNVLRFGESMVPAFIVVLATYFVLARKTT